MPHEMQQIAAKPKGPKMTHPTCARFSLEMEFRCLETSGKTFVYHNNRRDRDSKEYHKNCHDQTATRTTAARITVAAETTTANIAAFSRS